MINVMGGGGGGGGGGGTGSLLRHTVYSLIDIANYLAMSMKTLSIVTRPSSPCEGLTYETQPLRASTRK